MLAGVFRACFARLVNGPADTRQALDVLYEDNHLLVINKPAGLLSQAAQRGDDHVVARVERYLVDKYAKPGRAFVGLVHRLDRNTSGVLVLARTSKAAERLSAAIRERRFSKRYLAVVSGRPASAGQLVHDLVSDEQGSRVVASGTGKACDLTYARRSESADFALLEVLLGSGRKHQIRVQCAAAGFPLVGDRRYGDPATAALIGRTALHAASVELPHPTRGESLTFHAPLPADLSSLCGRLRLL